MAKDLKNILLSTIEENKIKEKTPDKLPLNPTAEGWSGHQVRRFLAKSLIDNEGSFLAEFKNKMTEIKTQFEDVFGDGDGDIQGQIDSIVQDIVEIQDNDVSTLARTVSDNYNTLNDRIDQVDIMIRRVSVYTEERPFAGFRTIDGHTLQESDTILVVGNGSDNGIYIVNTGGVWQRIQKVEPFQVVSIDNGIVYGGSMQKKMENGTTLQVKNPERSSWRVLI